MYNFPSFEFVGYLKPPIFSIPDISCFSWALCPSAENKGVICTGPWGHLKSHSVIFKEHTPNTQTPKHAELCSHP